MKLDEDESKKEKKLEEKLNILPRNKEHHDTDKVKEREEEYEDYYKEFLREYKGTEDSPDFGNYFKLFAIHWQVETQKESRKLSLSFEMFWDMLKA